MTHLRKCLIREDEIFKLQYGIVLIRTGIEWGGQFGVYDTRKENLSFWAWLEGIPIREPYEDADKYTGVLGLYVPTKLSPLIEFRNNVSRYLNENLSHMDFGTVAGYSSVQSRLLYRWRHMTQAERFIGDRFFLDIDEQAYLNAPNKEEKMRIETLFLSAFRIRVMDLRKEDEIYQNEEIVRRQAHEAEKQEQLRYKTAYDLEMRRKWLIGKLLKAVFLMLREVELKPTLFMIAKDYYPILSSPRWLNETFNKLEYGDYWTMIISDYTIQLRPTSLYSYWSAHESYNLAEIEEGLRLRSDVIRMYPIYEDARLDLIRELKNIFRDDIQESKIDILDRCGIFSFELLEQVLDLREHEAVVLAASNLRLGVEKQVLNLAVSEEEMKKIRGAEKKLESIIIDIVRLTHQ